MPIRTRGDQDRIDITAREQFAHVAVCGAVLVAVLAVGFLLHRATSFSLDVANRHEANVRFFQETTQVVGAAIADTNAAQHDLFAWRYIAFPSEHPRGHELWQGEDRTGLDCGGEKIAAVGMLFSFAHMRSPV